METYTTIELIRQLLAKLKLRTTLLPLEMLIPLPIVATKRIKPISLDMKYFLDGKF